MDPLVFVIFGASGDLTKRKLIPSIYQLYRTGNLPERFAILGVSRTTYSDEDYSRKFFLESEFIKNGRDDEKDRQSFASHIFYQSIDTNAAADYGKVQERLHELDEKHQTQGNYLFYLATPPHLYGEIPAYLAQHGLNDQATGWKRLIIEKPFGNDARSARELNQDLQEYFQEDQIYRIDHYLGKETVQNLLVTRFANGIFEPLWNRNYIQHIEITSAEDIGVENRGGYYDESGALRDMVQNHLLQILAHIAMEPPITADARDIRNEKVKLFQSLRPIPKEDVDRFVVRGQYISARIEEQMALGYRQEKGVPDDSRTETYVAIKCFVDNWRWAGVPFFIRTGKRLPTKVTELSVAFKQSPQHLFIKEDGIRNEVNRLVIRIQPDEGLALQFGMKVPGAGFQVKDVMMDFHYSDLTDAYVPEAYERLLMDCIKGDPTLYSRGDAVEAAWSFVDPIIEAWQEEGHNHLYAYPAGSWGPREADRLFDGLPSRWRNPCPALTLEQSTALL